MHKNIYKNTLNKTSKKGNTMFKTLLIYATVVFTAATVQAGNANEFQNAIKGELYTAESQPELYCLAMNIYHEARAEPVAGQYAVADVTINRTLDKRYPGTICGVVMQARMKESWKTKQYPDLPDDQRKYIPIRNQCQFSWFCDGRSDAVRDSSSWRKAQEIAYRIVQERKFRGITEGATHYHADYVSPKWRHDFDLVGRVGVHIFYRWN